MKILSKNYSKRHEAMIAGRAAIDVQLQKIRIAASRGEEVFLTDLQDALKDYEKSRAMDATLKCADCCKEFDPEKVEHYKIDASAVNSVTGARMDQIRMVLCASCFEQNEIVPKKETKPKGKDLDIA